MTLEQVFKCPRTLNKLRTGPLGELMDGFCTALLENGFTLGTIRRHLSNVHHLKVYRSTRNHVDGQVLSAEAVREFFSHYPAWARNRGSLDKHIAGVKASVNRLVNYLRCLGRFEASTEVLSYQPLLAAYLKSRIASVVISPFDSELCTASRGACIPQPDNGPLLESLSDRLMHRLQIRDFDDYLTMVTAHTVDVGDGRAGIRWYELRDYKDFDGWQLHQEGTFGPADGQYRWMPSAAMNSVGDIGIGYLLASTERYVSIAAVGQTALNSQPGILNSEELVCAHGSGVQEEVSRAGDYSSTSVDPNDDSFWHTNEVFHESGPYKWDTFVCEFVVADNGGGTNTPPKADFSHACNELTCSFTDTSTDPGGLITSWSWDFGGDGMSTEQHPVHTFTAVGDYMVTLTVTDDLGATGSETQNVSVATGGEPTLDGSAELTSGSRWKAIVEDTSGGELTGTWSASGTPLCVGSVCILSNIHKKISSVTFTADGSGVQITVLKP